MDELRGLTVDYVPGTSPAVPGGVGTVTTSVLLKHTMQNAMIRNAITNK